jgi:molybdopterin converting factor subunit 1
VGMRVRVHLYGPARDAAGAASRTVKLESGATTVRDLLDRLAEERPSLEPLLKGCRVAVNGTYVPGARHPLADGDEVAVHPPYSGG